MSSIIEIAQAQFKEKMSGALKFVDVPEWKNENGELTRIYFKPSATFSQFAKTSKLFAQQETVKAIIQTFIDRALDAEGRRLFNQMEFLQIEKHCDPEVITRIVTEMNNGEVTQEETKKN
jgi:succinate dehydrogenase/fumarate reductase flavoprotein subunit